MVVLAEARWALDCRQRTLSGECAKTNCLLTTLRVGRKSYRFGWKMIVQSTHQVFCGTNKQSHSVTTTIDTCFFADNALFTSRIATSSVARVISFLMFGSRVKVCVDPVLSKALISLSFMILKRHEIVVLLPLFLSTLTDQYFDVKIVSETD